MIRSGGADVNEVFLTPEQAAEMLNLSAYTIRAYARQGVIPVHKIGRTWRFSRSDLEEWVLANRQSPSHEDVLVARDRLSSVATSPLSDSTDGGRAAGLVDERCEALRTLLDIRARARKGNLSAVLQESRRELLEKGSAGRDGK